jgi:energy-coupling factor transporter ATP-binding protein EcfA2
MVIGIIGPPGVGKSTIMNALYGYDGSSPGTIFIYLYGSFFTYTMVCFTPWSNHSVLDSFLQWFLLTSKHCLQAHLFVDTIVIPMFKKSLILTYSNTKF